MERVKHHYCWIKVVSSAATGHGEDGAVGDVGLTNDAAAWINWTHGAGHSVAAPSTLSLKPPGSPKPGSLSVNPLSLKPPAAPKPKGVKKSGKVVQPLSLKPPAVASAVLPDAPPAPFYPAQGLLFGGSTFMGCWQFEQTAAERRSGANEVVPRIICQPVLGARQDALAWLDGPDGQAWSRDALSVSLLAFVAIGAL